MHLTGGPTWLRSAIAEIKQWCNISNEVFLRVTNHTGQAEKNLCLSGMVRHSEKHLITILHPSSLSHNN